MIAIAWNLISPASSVCISKRLFYTGTISVGYCNPLWVQCTYSALQNRVSIILVLMTCTVRKRIQDLSFETKTVCFGNNREHDLCLCCAVTQWPVVCSPGPGHCPPVRECPLPLQCLQCSAPACSPPLLSPIKSAQAEAARGKINILLNNDTWWFYPSTQLE